MAAALTPGRVTAAWLVIRTIDKLGDGAPTADVDRYARRSSLRGGGLPVKDGITLTLAGGLATETAGGIALSDLGRRALAMSDSDDPPRAVSEFLTRVLLLARPPSWVAWWQGQPESLETVIPSQARDLMHSCGLLPPPGPEDLGRWGWWQALGRVPLVEHSAQQRKMIGNAGEQLTIEFEQRRLTAEGFPHLAEDVRWVAQESDAFGFDVLSYRGLGDNGDPDDELAIEVKSTSVPPTAYFHFFLSSHEWETAQVLGDRYRFHFWAGVDPAPPPTSHHGEPIVSVAEVLVDHLPGVPRCADRCAWKAASIYLAL
jgi:hypothetical protein